MKFHKNKFLTTIAAAALALAVGACSSNGDDDEISMLQTDLDAATAKAAGLQEDLDEANAALMTANGMVTDLQGQLDTANAGLMTANGTVTDLQGQLDTANADLVTANDNAAAIQGMLDTANADVTRLMGELTDAGNNAAAIQGMLDTANADVTRLTGELTTATDNAGAIQGMLDTANADVTRLTGELADATDNADAIQGMLDTANADVTRLTGELADASTRADTAEGEVTRLTGELADANTRADTAEGEVERLTGELETANAELAKIRLDAADALTKAARDERIAREAGVNTAIRANRVGTTGTAFPTGITEQAVKRDAAGKVTVDVNGATADDYAGGETTAGSGDWNSVTLTKTDVVTEAEDTVVFYTDIEAPSDKLLTAQYTQDQLDDALDTTTVSKAASSGFPSEPGTTWVYTGADDERAKTVTGTFDGVPGQFTCSVEADCSVATNSDGELMESDNWRFTPDSPNTATVKDPDVAYAYFGWWLNKPKANDGMHDVEVFAGGTTDHEADVTNEIVGNATYSGPAAGKYVTKTFSAGVHSDSGVGHFTATANLTAKFGAADAAGTIGGSVTGFVLDDVTTAPWKVILEDATLSTNTATFDGTSEVDFGGGPTSSDAGTWQGSFYDDADATDNTNAPGTVAGTFDAVTDNANVIGGFGATKQ